MCKRAEKQFFIAREKYAYLASMTSEVVIRSKGKFRCSSAAMRGSKRNADQSSGVTCSQPSFLIIISPIQLPAFVLFK